MHPIVHADKTARPCRREILFISALTTLAVQELQLLLIGVLTVVDEDGPATSEVAQSERARELLKYKIHQMLIQVLRSSILALAISPYISVGPSPNTSRMVPVDILTLHPISFS